MTTEASAEEVVQETWLAVVRGLDDFEGRSTLRTWVFRILVNTAKRRGAREQRVLLWSDLSDEHGPTVDPSAFQGVDDQYPGGWRTFPQTWRPVDEAVLDAEVREQLGQAVSRLPDRQRIVVTLRDVLGHSSREVCDLLDISAANQRVLLHRARASLRTTLASYLAPEPVTKGGHP